MPERLTLAHLRARVQGQVERAGSRRAVAARLGVDRSAIEDLLAGQPATPALQRALRLTRVHEYERLRTRPRRPRG